MNEDRFDNMGEIYAQFRPSYPAAFMRYLAADVGMSADGVVADIGAGTGILTRLLLEAGHRVYAVEPNDDMRRVAERDLSPFEGFVPVCGEAEATGLADGSVDLVTVAQAYHWFDRAAFRAECRRILKAGGKVALVWNCGAEDSAIVQENAAVNKQYCPNFKGFSGGMMALKERDDFSDFFADSYEHRVFANGVTFDEDGFVGRSLSSSYAPKEDDASYAAYVAALRALFARHSQNGAIVFPYEAHSYTGRV